MAVISKKTALIWVLLVAGILALWKFVWKPMNDDRVASPANKELSENMMNTAEKQVSVRTHYNNPGGGDDVAFTLSVDSDGIITSATTDVLAVNPTSQMRQQAFAADFPQALVGKKLSELALIDRVGGSSLTTGAFNAALVELKAGI